MLTDHSVDVFLESA